MKKTTTSKKFRLNLRDLLRGTICAALAAVVGAAGQLLEVWLNSPVFEIDKVSLVLSLKTAIAGGLGYLVKNFVTPAQTIITNQSAEEEVGPPPFGQGS